MKSLRFGKPGSVEGLPYDPKWAEFVIGLKDQIAAIATKVCGHSNGLHEDCIQQALMQLICLDPTRIRGYEEYIKGNISEERWKRRASSYARMAARNIMVDYLRSYLTGPYYTSRYVYKKEAPGKPSRKVEVPPRYARLDLLMDEFGLQVTTDGEVTWERINTGLNLMEGEDA